MQTARQRQPDARITFVSATAAARLTASARLKRPGYPAFDGIQPSIPTMKILIVEDAPRTDDYLTRPHCDRFRDGSGARWPGRAGPRRTEHDNLMILDVMQPGLNGWQVLEGVRRAGAEMCGAPAAAQARRGA